MSIDRETLKSERSAALAEIAAHRSALGYAPVDLNDFDEIRFSIEDVLTSLRIYSPSAEVDFAKARRSSARTTRALFRAKFR